MADAPIRQVAKNITLSPRNIEAVRIQAESQGFSSFSRAVDTIISEGIAAKLPFFKPTPKPKK